MEYDPEQVRAAADAFGFDLTDAEAEAVAEKAAQFESAARSVSVSKPPVGASASAVQPGDDRLNGFNYRCSLGDSSGPLDNLRIGVKDNIAAVGVPMTCGSASFKMTPWRSATAVSRLVDAGGTVVDVTNMVSTGLIYPPQVQATTAGIQAFASHLHPYGRPFVAHIRNETTDIWNALEEFIRTGQQEENPLHLSHFKLALAAQHGKATRAIGILEAARKRGVDITADQYPLHCW